jgi:hypothetical protein
MPVLVFRQRWASLFVARTDYKHNQLFHSKWIECHTAPEALISHPDASSLANVGKRREVVRGMSLVPVDKSTLITSYCCGRSAHASDGDPCYAG